jgi:hypothetical protein
MIRASPRPRPSLGIVVSLALTMGGSALAEEGVQPSPSSPTGGASGDAASSRAAAPGRDVVELQDGSCARGTILAKEPGRYVILLGTDGAQTIPWQEIRRVVLASPPEAPEASPEPAPPLRPSPAGSAARLAPSESEPRSDAGLPSSWAGVSFGWDARLEANALLKQYAIDGGGSLWSGGPGLGGGLSASLHFRPPAGSEDDPRATWLDFEVGLGEALHYESYSDGLGRSMALLESETPIILGVHVAMGTFSGVAGGGVAWSGVVLGAAWTPTFVEFLGNGDFRSGGRLNPAGIRLTADVGSIRRGDAGRVPILRLVATWLPYVGELPTVFAAGVGCVFY